MNSGFTPRSVTPTLRAAIYAGYSGRRGFTLGRHAELVSASSRSMKKEEALNKGSFRAPLRSGFTLIELLVVVLIIGILAAVAVPQYRMAVEVTRAMERIQVIASLQKAVEVYILENGYPSTADSVDITDVLSITTPGSALFSFLPITCNTTACSISLVKWNSSKTNWEYQLHATYKNNKWEKSCQHRPDYYPWTGTLCQKLKTKGWK